MSKYYIARDKDNGLYAYTKKPSKRGWNFWQSDIWEGMKLDNTLFPEVKFRDVEPKILTIEENPWVRVEDGLPTSSKPVLCYCKQNSDDVYLVNYMNSKGNWSEPMDNIIAWMPILEFRCV